MKNNKILRVLTALFAVLIMTTGFSVTAFAYVDETEVTAEETATPDPIALTPDGNLTLVDDLSGEETEDKQFMTVVTKNGNYFYIIIDRASDSENVYFLNLVDESDLLALIEDADSATTSYTPSTVTQEPEATTTPDTTVTDTATETDTSGGIGGTVLVVLLIAALGGGAFYYFKVLKPKQAAQGSTDYNELDFEDEDESAGLISEPKTNNEEQEDE